jgi:DNA-binding NtrC family response regulator
LVVEDELRIRNMLSEALKQMGFHATLVPSAEAATRALVQRPFDILILDLNLPGMDGMSFLEAARREHRGLEVIILTGFGDLQAAQRAIRLDVVDFITKPFALGTLERALDRARKRFRGRLLDDPSSVAPAALESLLQFDTAPKPAPTPPPPAVFSEGGAAGAEAVSMEELEQRHILSVLHKHNGNRAATAAELGISLRKLYYRLGEYQSRGIVLP